MRANSARPFGYGDVGIHRFLDRYLDFVVEHSQLAALATQRRLSDAADIADIERSYSIPHMQLAARAGVDVELSLWSVMWCIHSFVYQSGGI